MDKDNRNSIFSYQNEVMENFRQKVSNDFEEKLKSYLIENLGLLGFKFNSDASFMEFLLNRVSRIEPSENKFYFFLDYKDEKNTGKLIGSYSSELIVNTEGGNVTVTLGENIN